MHFPELFTSLKLPEGAERTNFDSLNLLQCRDYHNNHHQSEQKSFKIQTYDENDVNKALVCLLNASVYECRVFFQNRNIIKSLCLTNSLTSRLHQQKLIFPRYLQYYYNIRNFSSISGQLEIFEIEFIKL